MSDDRRPFQDDDPTAIHRPIGGDGEWESTRVHSSVGDNPVEPLGTAAPGQKRDPGIVAPLVTVALLSLLVGLGLGYLLFSDDDEETTPPPGSATTMPALLDDPSTTLRSTAAPGNVANTTATTAGRTTTSVRIAPTAIPTTVTTAGNTASTAPGATVDPEARVPQRSTPAP